MATVASAIAARLAADAALTGAIPTGLGFAVFERWLVASGPGATPEAFDASRGGRLKRAVVVLDGGEVANPARSAANLRRWDGFPTLHVFAEAHATGKEAAHAAVLRAEALLHGWEPVVAGQRVAFRPDARLVLEDSDQFPGNITIVARWRATGSRVLVPA